MSDVQKFPAELRSGIFVVGAVIISLNVGMALAAPAPKLPLNSASALPTVVAHPYDENANADATVDAAFSRSRKSGKLVLIDLGGNWCPDCGVLASVVSLPEVKRFIAAHYEVANVDVGRFDKNLQVLDRFGIPEHLEYVPTVLIAEPNGELVNGGHFSDLADARNMSPQAIVDWLARWSK